MNMIKLVSKTIKFDKFYNVLISILIIVMGLLSLIIGNGFMINFFHEFVNFKGFSILLILVGILFWLKSFSIQPMTIVKRIGTEKNLYYLFKGRIINMPGYGVFVNEVGQDFNFPISLFESANSVEDMEKIKNRFAHVPSHVSSHKHKKRLKNE